MCYPFIIVQEVGYYIIKKTRYVQLFLKLVIVSCSTALQAGATIVLGRRFSVSRFWNDCVDYKVDVFTVSDDFF